MNRRLNPFSYLIIPNHFFIYFSLPAFYSQSYIYLILLGSSSVLYCIASLGISSFLFAIVFLFNTYPHESRVPKAYLAISLITIWVNVMKGTIHSIALMFYDLQG